jgi:DNA-binding LytR/AlgR family response regulator
MNFDIYEMKHRVSFHTLGCKLNFSESSTIARQFEDGGFVRVGSAYIINLLNVKNVSTSEVHLYNNITIPIPRGKHTEIKKAFWDFQCEGQEG